MLTHSLPVPWFSALLPALCAVACGLELPDVGDPPPLRHDLGGATWGDLPDPGGDDGADEGEVAGEDGAGSGDETTGGAAASQPLYWQLSITELLANPEGKDGAQDNPEFVEIANRGPESVDLGSLVVHARSWPTLRAPDLGLEGRLLQPGRTLTIQRFNTDAPAATTSETETGIVVGFNHSGGLRNVDGGVRIEDGAGNPADMVLYGAPQPPPFDDPGAWTGPPAVGPGSGDSLCRMPWAMDDDEAGNWVSCPPSPGVLPDRGRPRDPGPRPSLVIVEVLSNPVGSGPDEKLLEFVEILNIGQVDARLASLTVADSLDEDANGIDPLSYREGDGGCQPTDCLAPGRRAIIVGSAYIGETAGALVMEVDDTTIANAGLGTLEPVVVRDDQNEVMATYRAWEDPEGEPHPQNDELAMSRIDPMTADEPGNWVLAEPTPGGV